MAIKFTKDYIDVNRDYVVNLSIDDRLSCDISESYKTLPLVSGSLDVTVVLDTSHYVNKNLTINVNPYNGRASIIVYTDPTIPQLIHNDQWGTVLFNFDVGPDASTYPLTNQAAFPSFPIIYQDVHGGCSFSSNIPIFLNDTDANNYVTAPDDETALYYMSHFAINYNDAEYNPDTKKWYIENNYGRCNVTRGQAKTLEDMSWMSLEFEANTMPALWYSDVSYGLQLIAPNVVASYYDQKPYQLIENVDQSLWTVGSLVYHGSWYGNVPSREAITGGSLPDGDYLYAYEFNTNIPIFGNKADAEEAVETGDYSKAGNYADIINGSGYSSPDFGFDEDQTEFGSGADTSSFVQTYVVSRSALTSIAQMWYNTNPQTWQDILTGISMVSNVPIDTIAGVTMYPFDVNHILSTQEQHYMYFGTYYAQLDFGVNKVYGLKSGAYLDCGTINLSPLFYSFRDYPPYTVIDIYLPYIGWQRVDSRLLIGKSINIRYYVDIHTRGCTACILANGVLVSTHNGTIGVGMPTCATDYNAYANAMSSTILGGAGNISQGAAGIGNSIKGGLTDLSKGNAVGVSALGAAVGIGMGAASVAANTAATLNKLEAYGSPADHPIIMGGYTSGLGTYLPQKVIWRYTIHETAEPDGFNNLCGRPSSASGTISSFSGFLSAKQVQLNTNGMLDAESNEIYSLIKNGIYI